MDLSIGTFNLNNLFSRYNFKADLSAATVTRSADPDIAVRYSFSSDDELVLRKFMGRLIEGKSELDTTRIAERILRMDVDVLAVQEVEDIAVLRQFNRDYLGGRYPHVVLIEGNDNRLIDVGYLSKLPIGALTSYQTAEHPERPGQRVFSRDLLAIEIRDPGNRRKLLTLYNTHLKSNFVPGHVDPVDGAAANRLRRRHQAEAIAQIVSRAERKGGRFVLLGDMNDTIDSQSLLPMRTIDGEPLANALAEPLETRPAKSEREGDGPQTRAWTYRYNPPGRDPPVFSLYDQIWLSPALEGKLVQAHIDRRSRHGGDGSDHDPAWIELRL